ncbi:xanthine dehydrogenase family protein molybdopterin-binding subunit [Chloroflexota bacterium]
MSEFSVIGKRLPRVDARVKVTGEAKYAGDFELPGMLWGKLLGSPYAHARIVNIDTSRAEKLPGVQAIITGKDFGGYTLQYRFYAKDIPPLAADKVRHYAEPVAAVAATDEDIAEEATELIKVDYEELPGVFEPEEAMQDRAPQIAGEFKNNICVDYHWDFGDVQKGFDESYLVREDRFRTGRVTVGFLEPPAIMANYDPSGAITVWAAKAAPYSLYYSLADCFGLPWNKVRVIQPFIGGCFGGAKNMGDPLDFCAVMLSKKAGRPVKIVYTQEEVLTACSRRHPAIIDIKTGVKRDGSLSAIQIGVISDAGAYHYLSVTAMYLMGGLTTLPYKLPHYKYDGYAVLTNNPTSTAMRGFGVNHTRYAAEIQLEMLAEELGIDPVEIRLKNAIENPRPGSSYETINKVVVKSCGAIEAIEKVAASPLWKQRAEKEKEGSISRGTGLACGVFETAQKPGGWHQSCAAIVRVCEDGTINLLTGASDAGQGSDVVLCQITAEELGVALEDIDIKRVDTAYTPCDAGTWGSRVTFLAGLATQAAAADAKQQLVIVAAEKWGVKTEDIEIKDRKVSVKSDPKKSMPFFSLVRWACYSTPGAVIIGTGYSGHEPADCDFDTGVGNDGCAYSFAAQAAKVEVDMETGQIRCTDTTIAQDCGRALNPMSVEGQYQGGSTQGIGQVLYDEFIMDRGKTLNPTFLDYKLCRSTDVPDNKVMIVEAIDPGGPFGAKEASEATTVSAPPAVVSAIHDATGIWFKELPVTPEKMVKALKSKGNKD